MSEASGKLSLKSIVVCKTGGIAFETAVISTKI